MQFTLQTLLLFFVLFASALCAFGYVGIVLAVLLLPVIAWRRTRNPRWKALAIVCLVALCCGCLWSLFWLGCVDPKEYTRRFVCKNNLKVLAIALHGYYADHDSFPPAYIADADGKPMHSWRVLILPYLERKDLYDQYSLNEPWNGPNNSKLAGQRPDEFACPADLGTMAGMVASYVAVVGSRTAWPGEKSSNPKGIRGTNKTIFLVEMANSGISWMEPRDLTLEEALRGVNPPARRGISSRHTEPNPYYENGQSVGANIVFVDGSAAFLPTGLAPEKLEALLTTDGDKRVEWDRTPTVWEQWCPRCAFLVFLVSASLLFFWRRAIAAKTDRL